MSTPCLIGAKEANGNVRYIYCHFDGYIFGAGYTLNYNYKDRDKVEKLLDLGDLSSLGRNPIENPTAWTDHEVEDNNQCVSYRSRGEKDTEAKETSLEKYKKLLTANFIYLYDDDNRWKLLDFDSGTFKTFAG